MTKSQITFSQLSRFINSDLDAGNVPALVGEGGIGKSSFIKNLGKETGKPVFTFSMNVLSSREDISGPRIVENENPTTNDIGDKFAQIFFPHKRVQDAIKTAKENPDKKVILFLDEFNRVSAEITSATFQLITEREVGSIPLPDNIQLIAAGNDVGNVIALDSASVSRVIPYYVKPDIEQFLDRNPGLNAFVAEAIAGDDHNLLIPLDADSDIDNDAGFMQYTAPRTITMLSNALNALGVVGASDAVGTIEALDNAGLILDVSVDESNHRQNLLRTYLHAHIGENKLADTIENSIISFYNKNEKRKRNNKSTNQSVNVPDLTLLELTTDEINRINALKDVNDIDTFLNEYQKNNTLNVLLSKLLLQRNLTNINRANTINPLIMNLLNRNELQSYTESNDLRVAVSTAFQNGEIEPLNDLTRYISTSGTKFGSDLAALFAI